LDRSDRKPTGGHGFHYTLVFVFLLLAGTLPGRGEIPPGYYTSAIGLTGTPLQQALHDIIKNHTAKSYNYLWTAFQTADDKPNGTVWDIYSDVPDGTPNGNPPYTFTFITDQCGTASAEGDCYSREHSFPKSWFGGTVMPMYTDLFHIYPVDQYVNNRHNDNPFGVVSTPTWTSLNGSKLGLCATPGYSGTVFEPRDDYKGDIARSYFYMSVRYYTEDAGWPGSPMVTGSQLNPWALAMMIQWHQLDPVSQKEIDRNNVIYTIQNNRNPFIDHPDYVAAIWSSAPIKPEPTNHATDFSSVAGPPTYSAMTLTWTDAIGEVLPDGYLIRGSATGFDAINTPVDGTPVSDGGLNFNVAASVQTCLITGLSSSTKYYFRIFSYTNSGMAINYKTDGTIPSASATTTPGTGSGDIIISQYYEGTSNNKWIEITNLGPDVDLAVHPVYLLQILGAGPKNVTTTNPFLCASLNTGTFTSGSSRLVRNTLAVLPDYAVADYTNGNLNFNGVYDVIFLSASANTVSPVAWDARTDVVGEVVNDTTTSFSIANMSLYRRNNISTGSVTWSVNDWVQLTNTTVDMATQGTPERLGYHGFNYYSKPTGYLDDPLNWGTSTDGSGTTPASFNYINQVFTVQNRSAADISGDWTLLGTGSKMILGDGTTGTTCHTGITDCYLPALEIQTGSMMSVDSGATLTVHGTPAGAGCLTIRNGASLDNAGKIIVGQDLINENDSPVTLGQGTIDFNGVNRQRIMGQNIFHNLTINSEMGISITGNTWIEGILSLIHGRIRLNENEFTMGPEAAIEGSPSANAMIITSATEKLSKEFPAGFTGSFIFPVGDTTGTAEYSPVTLNFTAGTFDAGNFASVSVVNEKYPDPGITGNYLNRYWTITRTGIYGFSCNATFQYLPTDVTGMEGMISGSCIKPEAWMTFGPANTIVHQLFTGGISDFGSFTGLKSDTPPQNQELANIDVLTGQTGCYDATTNLTVAGNETLFVVDNGGSVTLVAGTRISLQPGVLVNSGGYFYAWITETGNYCSNPLSPVAANYDIREQVIPTIQAPGNNLLIKIYPNPNTGTFSLGIFPLDPLSGVQVTISNMNGKIIFTRHFKGQNIVPISLGEQAPGLYIVHVNTGSISAIAKILRD